MCWYSCGSHKLQPQLPYLVQASISLSKRRHPGLTRRQLNCKELSAIYDTPAQGMAWRSPPFIRPLLGTRKSNLVAFLRRREQEWREDPTNRVPKHARNRVRWASMRPTCNSRRAAKSASLLTVIVVSHELHHPCVRSDVKGRDGIYLRGVCILK